MRMRRALLVLLALHQKNPVRCGIHPPVVVWRATVMESMTLEELRVALKDKKDKYAWLERERQRCLDQLRNHKETCRAVESAVRNFHEGTLSVMAFTNAHQVESQVEIIARAMTLCMELIRRLTQRITVLQNKKID